MGLEVECVLQERVFFHRKFLHKNSIRLLFQEHDYLNKHVRWGVLLVVILFFQRVLNRS